MKWKKASKKKSLVVECPDCGVVPEILKGHHPTREKNVFWVECKNKQCTIRPSTGPCDNRITAIKSWNNRTVTNHLFSTVEG
jgi:hypothetical protein